MAGQPRVAAGERVGQQHPLRGHLGAGVAGAHHDEGRPRRPLGLVVAAVGQLVLPDDVVAQVERLGDVAEAVRVLGDAGHRQQLVDAAGGQQQLVVRQLAPGALRAEVRHPAAGEVHILDRAEHQPYAGQGVRDGHGDPPRVEHAAGHLGQQRQVEEVVGRVDQADLGGAAQPAAQRPGGVVAGEPAADDEDPAPGHGPSGGLLRSLRAILPGTRRFRVASVPRR